MNLKDIQELVFKEYRCNKFLDMWSSAESSLEPDLKGIVDLAELGLIMSEVVEAMEEIRNNKYSKLPEELADITIRVLNYASRKGIDIERAILEKHKRNLKRGYKHGRFI